MSTIQADTNEAVVSMERSTTDVVGGALLAENAGAALEEIEQVSNQIAMLVLNISASAREQSDMAKTALENVAKLNDISSKAEKSASITTKFINKLAALATKLRHSVAGFVLPGEQDIQPEPEPVKVLPLPLPLSPKEVEVVPEAPLGSAAVESTPPEGKPDKQLETDQSAV